MKITIFRSCGGTNNKVDAARIKFDPETGVIDLEGSKDMLIDKSGGLGTMRGTTLVAAGSFLSAYPAADGSSFYAVKNWSRDSTIEKVIPRADGSIELVGMRAGLTHGARMDFCLVDGLIYYMNGFELGVLTGDKSKPWPVSMWPRRHESTTQFVAVSAGNHLDMLGGRFIISYGNEIKYTELDLWGIIDENQNWRKMESRVLMVYAVGTGVFVSDEKAVYFFEGLNPNKWRARQVLTYPAIEFGRMPGLIDPSNLGFDTSSPSALFKTTKGLVVGLPDGQAINLIDKKVKMPQNGCNFGSIMVVDETTIISSGV